MPENLAKVCLYWGQKLAWQVVIVPMLEIASAAATVEGKAANIVQPPQTLKPGKKMCRWKSSSYNMQYQYTNLLVSPEIGPKPETSGSSVSLAILSARG